MSTLTLCTGSGCGCGSLIAEITVKYLKADNVQLLTPDPRLTEPLYVEGALTLRNGGAIAWHIISQQRKDIATALLPPRSLHSQRQWLSWAASHEPRTAAATISAALNGRTFLAAEHLTLADIVAYAAVHSWVEAASDKERLAFVDLLRWLDHLQHLPGWPHRLLDRSAGEAPKELVIKLPPLPELDLGSRPGAKSQDQSQPQSKTEQPSTAKKEKKVKKPSQSQPAAAAADERPVEDPTRLEIRVGKVLKVWPHPEADKLWCEEIDLGEGQPRKIASGLRAYVSQEEFEGRLVFVLANMKEKKLRGFGSHGMVICASAAEGAALPEGVKSVELLEVPAGAKVGDLVTFDGLSGTHDPVMNSKTGKDPCAAVLPGFRTDEKTRQAFWKDHAWICAGSTVTASSLAGAHLG